MLLAARPTRTLPRPAAHRQLVAEAAPRRDRSPRLTERSEREGRLEPASLHRAHPSERAEREAHFELVTLRRTHSSNPALPPARTLAEERALAARSAISAADHNLHSRPEETRSALRPESRPARPRHQQPVLVASTRDYSFARLRDSGPARLPADGTATGDEPAPAGSALALRPAPAAQPSISPLAASPVLLPPLRLASLYDSHGRLIVPPPLYGSHEILVHQNEMAERDGLDRIRDDADLLNLRREHKLVPLPESIALRVDYRLPADRRFSRPWTAAFLSVLARDFYAAFHTPLQVDSAVRTVQVQERLIHTNGNAAPAEGDTASPHLTGQAVDIAKANLTRLQIAWMRTYLQPLIDLGKIDVEEEFQQSCFHISVYRNFLPAAPARTSVAAAPSSPHERPVE